MSIQSRRRELTNNSSVYILLAMKKAMLSIRISEADMVLIKEVAKAFGWTDSDAARMLIRCGFSTLASQTGTPDQRGGIADQASNFASGGEAF